MKDKKRFVTLFPELLSVHLKKDVGMIPYSLKKYHNYSSAIVCYNNDNISESDCNKYNIQYVCKKKNDVFDFGKYLFKNAKSIDILNLYHITSRRNALWIIIYLLRNPKGKIYLKLDADFRMLNDFEMYPKNFKGKIKNFIFHKYVNLATVESLILKEQLINKWKIDIKLLPNGYQENRNNQILYKKESFFLTVGRLGTEQKSTEILLEAYRKIANQTNYNLVLIGNIEAKFNKYIEDFFTKNPSMKSRIRFLGNIDDNKILNEYYAKASIFVLPSKWEGFPLVLPEALNFGNYLILSDQVPPALEMTNHEKYGSIFTWNDTSELADKMLMATKIKFTEKYIEEIHNYAKSNYTWKVISEKLNKYLTEL